MFVDYVSGIEVVGGSGGDGIVSWIRAKYIPKGGPGGGNGGKGGSVVLKSSENVASLEDLIYKKCIKAGNGEPGGKNKCSGANGLDVVVNLPVGAIVSDVDDGIVLVDLDLHGMSYVVCVGGCGGKGNACFATPSNRIPSTCTNGAPGQRRVLSIELRHIANFGFVGLPNAGKSSLLRAITGSDAKVGDYPFTTIYPNLGTIKDLYGRSVTFADIPGIIHMASCGKGLGIRFLKHISRCNALIFVIDVSDESSCSSVFNLLKTEVNAFDPNMLNKRLIVVFNKIDLVDDAAVLCQLSHASFNGLECFCVSSKTGHGLDKLMSCLIC